MALLSTVDDCYAQAGPGSQAPIDDDRMTTITPNPCDRLPLKGDKSLNVGELVRVETPTGLHAIKRIFFYDARDGSYRLVTVRGLITEGWLAKAPVNVWKLEAAGRGCKLTFEAGFEVLITDLTTDYFPVGLARSSHVREGVASLLFTVPK
jgi:hypothetical protein